MGAKPLVGSPEETVTEGLDGLRERCQEYYELGARFTKWQAVINIGAGRPSEYAIWTNAHRSPGSRRSARRPVSCPSSSPR